MQTSPLLAIRLLTCGCLLGALQLSNASAQSTWVGAGANNSISTSANWDPATLPNFAGGIEDGTNTVSLIFNNNAQDAVVNMTTLRRAVRDFSFEGAATGAFTFTNTGRWILTPGGAVTIGQEVTNPISIGRLGVGSNAPSGSYTILNNATNAAAFMTNISLVAYATNGASFNLILDGVNTGNNRINGLQQNASAGALSVTKNGSGTWILGAPGSPNYAGGVTVNDGILGLGGNTSLGTGTLTINGGAVASAVTGRTLANNIVVGGDFGLGGLAQPLTLNGNVDLGGATRTITLGNSATLGGVISNGGLVLESDNNTRSLTLTDNSSYTGPTTVNGGILRVNGSLATSTLTVNAGGILEGSGSISGDTVISGVHSPGTSPGLQSFGGDLAYSDGATVVWELTGNTTLGRGSAYDGIDVAGNLDFSGTVSLSLVFNTAGSGVSWLDDLWASDQQWIIYNVGGSTSGVSNFQVAVEDWADGAGLLFSSNLSGSSFGLSQVGDDVLLSYVVPEPSIYALLGLSAAAFAGYRLRRRKRDGK